MEVFLFERDEYSRKYNCTFYDVNNIPVEERRHVLLGAVVLLSYFFFTTLYIACLYGMLTSDYRRKASYRLMIFLGFVHLTGLQTSGFLTGILSMQGAVFCTNPVLIYVGGGVAVSTWCASTVTSLILGFNRCIELVSDRWSRRLFHGKRVFVWMAVPLGWLLYIFVFTPPPIFNGVWMAAFFNPHYGFVEDREHVYFNRAHRFNNLTVCCTEPVVYGTLIVLYLRATRTHSTNVRSAALRDRKVYLQIICVGTIHFFASLSYVCIQSLPANFFLLLLASTFYLLSQGTPPVIYLVVNRSLRNLLVKRLHSVVKRAFPLVPPVVHPSRTQTSGPLVSTLTASLQSQL
ncbi:hypothetical protein M3Y99_00927700 [Aphelenchoides fujianensis]|nr:hypothetical protein M3Y99_00927700 [Aphelenchoides fujianensis]